MNGFDISVLTTLLNGLSTGFMAGLIWFVQIVHYPLLNRVSPEAFSRYHRRHMNRTALVVAVPMLMELVTSVYLFIFPPFFRDSGFWTAGLLLVAVIWISTLVLQIPIHKQLNQQHSTTSVRFLVRSNWSRTLAWTLRGVLWTYLLWTILATRAGY